MNALADVRTVHLAASVLLAGAYAFVLLVVPRHDGDAASRAARAALHRWLVRACGFAVALALVSWLAWLVLVAQGMGGGSLRETLEPDLLRTVLLRTTFGTGWLLRFAALAMLAVVLTAWRRRDDVD